jgi:hypothetical protein
MVSAVLENKKGFQPGNKCHLLREINNGGRPPSPITAVRQELEEHPHRIRQLLDNIYNLAMNGEGEKIRLMASIDYLDRVGFRTPKEERLTVQGMVVVGGPEDYRRASMLLSIDKEQEQALLTQPVNTSLHNSDCATLTPIDNTPIVEAPAPATDEAKVDEGTGPAGSNDTAGPSGE